jgi:hypothetical protein
MIISGRRVFAGTAIVLGLAMAAWGALSFAKREPQQPVAGIEDEGIRMCPPTIGELLDLGPSGRKLGTFVVFVAGLVVISGSAISLMPKESDHGTGS